MSSQFERLKLIQFPAFPGTLFARAMLMNDESAHSNASQMH
jgi:hypothetical protein